MEVVEAEVVQQRWTPWGFWTTAGFSLAVAGVYVAIQTAVGVVFVFGMVFSGQSEDLADAAEWLENNGLLLAVATCLAAPLCVGLVTLLAWIRKPPSVRRYLALEPVSAASLFGWVMLLGLFAAAADGLTILLGRPVVPEFMSESYRTAVFVPLLWLALIVMAPAFEEVFFRGFVFQGIRFSRLGVIGAIALTSLAWAACHVQYDLYQMAIIFAGGILLGLARWRSGSLYPPLAMHAAMNVIATIQAAVSLR